MSTKSTRSPAIKVDESSSIEATSQSVFAVDPSNHAQQSSLVVDNGRASGVPGSVRYTAPYYLPPDMRKGVPRVLYTDPWPSMLDREVMQEHAQACLQFLREAGAAQGKPMSAEALHAELNQREVEAGRQPMLPSMAYTTNVLERLREERLIAGGRNQASELSPGHPNYPYLYKALPEQALHKKPEGVLAKMAAKRDAQVLKRAMNRLRHGKTPYAIHRQVAHHSVFQYALAQEAVQAAMQKASGSSK